MKKPGTGIKGAKSRRPNMDSAHQKSVMGCSIWERWRCGEFECILAIKGSFGLVELEVVGVEDVCEVIECIGNG
jgi:hypothetical protein